MRYRICCIAALVLASLLAGLVPAAGQGVVRYGPAQIVETAPFYLYADESRGPLEALKPGTSVTVLEIKGDWVLVEYQDPRFGVRQGYVKARFVKSGTIDGPPPPASPAAKPAQSAPAPPPARPAQPPTATQPPPRGATAKPAKPAGKGWRDRALVAINGAYQSGASSFSESFTFQQYVERATIKTDYPAKDGPGFDAAAGLRVWKGLALGAGVTRTDRSTTASISGTIPHPFHFNTLRPVSGIAAISRTETAIHALAAWVLPAGQRFLVTVSGGPSYFTVRQSLVENAPFTEAYPYDSAELSSPFVTKASKSAVGFNAGIDLGFYFTPIVGVGAGVRYARGTVDLPLHGATISTDAGGVQALVGLRLRVPRRATRKPAAKAPAPPPRNPDKRPL